MQYCGTVDSLSSRVHCLKQHWRPFRTRQYFAKLSLTKRVNNLVGWPFLCKHASLKWLISLFSSPVCLIIYCCCKEKIDSNLVYCTLIAGHHMGDPFEVSTIRREVSMLVFLKHLEMKIQNSWTSSVIFMMKSKDCSGIFCH